MHYERSFSLLLLKSALSQLLFEDLLAICTRAYFGHIVFCEVKVERSLGSESLGYWDKAPGKKFHDKFREYLKHA